MGPSRQTVFTLQDLCRACNCRRCGVGGFRRCSVCLHGGSFLISSRIVAFASASNGLVTLGPSIALSVIGGATSASKIRGICCGRGICHITENNNNFHRVVRIKLRYLNGASSCYLCRALLLTTGDLRLVTSSFILSISRVNIIIRIVSSLKLSTSRHDLLLGTVTRGGPRSVTTVSNTRGLRGLVTTCNSTTTIQNALRRLCPTNLSTTTTRLLALIRTLRTTNFTNGIHVSFSILGSYGCCGNVIFRNFIDNVPASVLSNNRCSPLVGGLNHRTKTINFTICVSQIGRLTKSATDCSISAIIICDSHAPLSDVDTTISTCTTRNDAETYPTMPSRLACHRLIGLSRGKTVAIRARTWYHPTREPPKQGNVHCIRTNQLSLPLRQKTGPWTSVQR